MSRGQGQSQRQGQGQGPTEVPATSAKRRSLLEHALANEGVAELLSAEEWREEAKAMVVAGQGTVAHCLSFTLLLLAMHPEQQRRLHQVRPSSEPCPASVLGLGLVMGE